MALENIKGIEEEMKKEYPTLYDFSQNSIEDYNLKFGKDCGEQVRLTILQTYLLTKIKK